MSTGSPKMFRSVCISIFLTFGAAMAWAATDSNEPISTLPVDLSGAEEANLGRIEALLEAKEFEDAIDLAAQAIAEILQKTHQYDEELVDPLLMLGDGFRALSEYPLALDAYLRARQITRIANGLHTLDQVQVLSREAETLYAMNKVPEANALQERAFAVHQQHYGKKSKDILPGMHGLADWYLHTGNVFAARSVFRSCVKLAEEVVKTGGNRAKIDCLKGLAKTYRRERWGNALTRVIDRTPLIQNKRERKERFQTLINDYAPGERALLDVVRMLLAQEAPDFVELTEAKLELADWYLLFGDLKRAFVVYGSVLNSDTSGDPDSFIQKELSTPKLLYIRYPTDDLPERDDSYEGQVLATIAFDVTVSRTGKVQDASLVSISPETLDDRRYRSNTEFARFRPAFENGLPVAKRAVPLIYEFNYVPPG